MHNKQADVLASSAYAMVCFMDNHCMLQLFNRPQWKTVKGRSQWVQLMANQSTYIGIMKTHTCTLLNASNP